MPVKLIVRCFKASEARVKGVRLTLLKLESVDHFEESSDAYDAIAGITEAYTKEKGCDYVEVEVEGHHSRILYGDSREYQGSRMLFPRPARLYRLGLLRSDNPRLRRVEGYYVIEDSSIEWYRPRGKYYVFESKVEAPEEVLYIIVDTEYGRRWIRTQRHVIARLSSQTPQEPGREPPESEPSGGGDSSPYG